MPPLFYNAQTSKLLEIPEANFDTHQLSNEVVPLIPLLISEHFPRKEIDYSDNKQRQWDREQVLRIGTLVTLELAELEPPMDFTSRIVHRLCSLGVFPNYDYLSNSKNFGGFTEFKRRIGVDLSRTIHDNTRNAEYDNLDLEELADLLIHRYNTLVELPDGEPYEGPLINPIYTAMNRMGLAPAYEYLEKRFGGVGPLNEYLGYPDVRKWDIHDYIQYGATILRYNGDDSITTRSLVLLSKHHFGPTTTAILKRFDWEQFKNLSREELKNQLAVEQNHRIAVEQYYQQNVDPMAANVPFSEKALHRGIWLLLGHYRLTKVYELPSRLRSDSLNTIIAAIKRERPRVTDGDIESIAVMLHIFDDLWPMPHPKRLPIIANFE